MIHVCSLARLEETVEQTGARHIVSLIGDEGRVDAAESIGKSLQQSLQPADDLGEFVQRATAVKLSRVMDHDLDAKYAFAFAIDLESQASTVQLEDRQIIGSLSTATSHSAARFLRERYFGLRLHPRIVLTVFRSSRTRLRSIRA